jgi:hypothetical protein
MISESNKMTSRWCNARQHVIDSTRALIDSEECTYNVKTSKTESDVAMVEKLLDGEAFHLGKTKAVSSLNVLTNHVLLTKILGYSKQGGSISTPGNHILSLSLL